MKSCQVILLILGICFFPNLSIAQNPLSPNLSPGNDVVFFPSYVCKVDPNAGHHCTAQVFSVLPRAGDTDAMAVEAAAAKMRGHSLQVYTITATNAGLELRDKRIAEVETKLTADLEAVKALIPQQLGKTVEASVKANMKDTLLHLMANDEQFRKELANILKPHQ